VSLRYGYVTNGLSGHRLGDALRLLADCGYDGVALTLDPVHFDPFEPRLRSRAAKVGALCAELGLEPVIETGGRYVLDPRRKHHPSLVSDGRERRIDLLRRAVEVAAEIEAPVVSIWSGTLPKRMDREVAWELLLDGCQQILATAERHGVRIGFEPEPGMLVERLIDFEQLARDLGQPPALGVTLDLGHCVCLEPGPVTDCVQRASRALVHVHADDMRRGVHDHLMFGEGELDVATALRALGEIRYRGLVAVELSRHAHAAHEVVPRALAYLREREPRPRSGARFPRVRQLDGTPMPMGRTVVGERGGEG
jgi:L-ribulose-5-phosphate 3-epimerase